MEKAKAFFLICTGILMLAVAIHIGTDRARADFEPGIASPVVGFSGENVLYENGEVWKVKPDGVWELNPEESLPIPLVEIAFWESTGLVAINGDHWKLRDNVWENFGLAPFGTATRSSDWSELKSSFGK